MIEWQCQNPQCTKVLRCDDPLGGKKICCKKCGFKQRIPEADDFIRFWCPKCGKALTTERAGVGVTIRCNKCKARVVVPEKSNRIRGQHHAPGRVVTAADVEAGDAADDVPVPIQSLGLDDHEDDMTMLDNLIRWWCPDCDAPLTARREAVGAHVRCRICHNRSPVPEDSNRASGDRRPLRTPAKARVSKEAAPKGEQAPALHDDEAPTVRPVAEVSAPVSGEEPGSTEEDALSQEARPAAIPQAKFELEDDADERVPIVPAPAGSGGSGQGRQSARPETGAATSTGAAKPGTEESEASSEEILDFSWDFDGDGPGKDKGGTKNSAPGAISNEPPSDAESDCGFTMDEEPDSGAVGDAQGEPSQPDDLPLFGAAVESAEDEQRPGDAVTESEADGSDSDEDPPHRGGGSYAIYVFLLVGILFLAFIAVLVNPSFSRRAPAVSTGNGEATSSSGAVPTNGTLGNAAPGAASPSAGPGGGTAKASGPAGEKAVHEGQ